MGTGPAGVPRDVDLARGGQVDDVGAGGAGAGRGRGARPCLIGGDFRKPQVDTLVGAARTPSLQDLATLDIERPTVDEWCRRPSIDNLYMAVAGDPTREVAGLVDAAKEVCMEAVRAGRDGHHRLEPAAGGQRHPRPAARSVDYVIFVLRAGKSGETDLLDTIETLRRMDSNLLGIVLIGTPAGPQAGVLLRLLQPQPRVEGRAQCRLQGRDSGRLSR